MDGLEAQDAVQETWLRFQASPTPPASTKPFLSAMVTRISIDMRSAHARREEHVGPWLPEPHQDPERSAELADSLSMAALLRLERFSPLEQAIFVLREVFGFGFPDIASAVGRPEATCRQLAVRARRHMDAAPGSPPRDQGNPPDHETVKSNVQTTPQQPLRQPATDNPSPRRRPTKHGRRP